MDGIILQIKDCELINLHLDLLNIIFNYLSFNDKINFKNTCKLTRYNLHIINISNVNLLDKITDEILKYNPYIKTLHINKSSNITNIGLSYLKQLNILIIAHKNIKLPDNLNKTLKELYYVCVNNIEFNENLENIKKLYITNSNIIDIPLCICKTVKELAIHYNSKKYELKDNFLKLEKLSINYSNIGYIPKSIKCSLKILLAFGCNVILDDVESPFEKLEVLSIAYTNINRIPNSIKKTVTNLDIRGNYYLLIDKTFLNLKILLVNHNCKIDQKFKEQLQIIFF
jgi:hypothetical protein